jgi:hypothetical protein
MVTNDSTYDALIRIVKSSRQKVLWWLPEVGEEGKKDCLMSVEPQFYRMKRCRWIVAMVTHY